MAKKRKKTTGNTNSNKSESLLTHVGTTSGFGKQSSDEAVVTHESKARQAMRTTLDGKFRAFHFVVEANEALLKRPFYSLEVDEAGRHTDESFALLKRVAEMILSCNFQPRGSKRDDLTWAEARWSKESGLDPHLPFEVGLCVSRRPNEQRQAKTLAVLTCPEKIGGLGLVPDQDGKHLDIPGAGILFTRDMVLVSRNGHHLGTCSIMEALQGSHRAEWRKALPEELQAREAEMMVRQAEREEAAKADQAAGMFLEALEEIKQEEELAKLDRAKAAWTHLAAGDSALSEKWDTLAASLNTEWGESQDEVDMVNGLVRPGNPQREAVQRFARLYRDHIKVFAQWIKDTYALREKMTPPECVVLLREQVDGLVDEWFQKDGTPVEALKPLAGYDTYQDLEAAVESFPDAGPKAAGIMAEIVASLEEEGEGEEETTS